MAAASPCPSMLSENLIGLIGNTPLVELKRLLPQSSVRIFAKLEGQNPTGSLKDRIALYMIKKAIKDGSLDGGRTILEPTSGNTGISLAMIARLSGYSVKVVMPENVSLERTQILRAYGTDIHFTDGSTGTNGAILEAQKLAARDGNYFMPFQYGNEANPRAHYETTGAEIIRDLPGVDVFVSGLGTGGTLMGVGRKLKEHNPLVKVIAAAPEPEDFIQGLRSLEDGFIPPILDLSVLDGRVMVNSADSFHYTKELLHTEGIFSGISSGAVICCALRVAERMTHGNIVCLLADGGWKYLSTDLWNKDYTEMGDEAKGKIWW